MKIRSESKRKDWHFMAFCRQIFIRTNDIRTRSIALYLQLARLVPQCTIKELSCVEHLSLGAADKTGPTICKEMRPCLQVFANMAQMITCRHIKTRQECQARFTWISSNNMRMLWVLTSRRCKIIHKDMLETIHSNTCRLTKHLDRLNKSISCRATTTSRWTASSQEIHASL